MFPPSPYAHPVSSFQFPVDPPTVDPTDDPVQQVCINKTWLPYVVGALKQLLLQSTWRDLDDTALELVQSRVFDLMAQFQPIVDGCGVLAPDLGCFGADFRDAFYGTESDPAQPCTMGYDHIVGWSGCDDSSLTKTVLSIKHSFNNTFVRSYEIIGTAPASQPSTITYEAFLGGVSIATATHFHTAGSFVDDTWFLNSQADAIIVTIVPDDFTKFLTYTFQSFVLCYAGDFPFSNVPVATWRHEFDFTVSDGGWVGQPCGSCSLTPLATYVGSTGWEGRCFTITPGHDEYAANIQIDLTESTVEQIVVTYDATNGNYSAGNISDAIRVYLSGTEVSNQVSSAPGPTGSDVILIWNGSEAIDHILVSIWKAHANTTSCGSAAALIKHISVFGIGTDPF